MTTNESARAPDEIDLRVGARLRDLRLALNLEARLLDAAIAARPGTVEKYESGAKRVGAAQLFRLAHVLGVPVPYFFASEGGDVPSQEPHEGAIAGRRTGEAQRFALAVSKIADPEVQGRIRRLVKSIAEGTAVSGTPGDSDDEVVPPTSA